MPRGSIHPTKNLLGKEAGDVLFEMLGPIDNRNHVVGGKSEVHIQVFGGGEVTLQWNGSIILRGQGGGAIGRTSPIHVQRHPDPGAWANVTGAIDLDQTDLLTTIDLNTAIGGLPTEDFNFLRLIVGTGGGGDGKAVMSTDWNR